jgi:glucan phosphoethanolaminetransferase (alkaline phosphatase superfamily)
MGIGGPRLQFAASTFPIFALALPNALFLSEVTAAHSTQAGAWPAIQAVTLILGVTLLLIGVALAVCRWSIARRLVHLSLFFILLDVFYRIAYGGPVTPGLLQAVQQTSRQESVELLAGHPALTVGLSLLGLWAIVALVAAWRAPVRGSLKAGARVALAGLLVLMASVLANVVVAVDNGPCCTRSVAMVTGVFPIDVATSFGAVADDWYRSRRDAASRAAFQFPNPRLLQAASRRNTREVYVIVIGETSRRQNWSLFGYSRPTTPNLDKMASNLITYRMLSNATNTVLSLPMALTRATPTTRDRILTEKSLVTLLNQSGFDTFWISNQERPGLPSNPIYQIAAEARHVSFHTDSRQAPDADPFDTNLLPRLDAALAGLRKDGKAAIFLHMEGSHFSYKERYPASFGRFDHSDDPASAMTDRQRRFIDQYDNTVVFTDYILSRVVGRLRSCDCVAGMVYFSDHGERLFDNGTTDNDFGHGFPDIARQEIEVPFIAWLSPEYERANPSLAGGLRAHEQGVAELHDLFETIVDLTGVDYDDREPALSLFSHDWKPPADISVLTMDAKAIAQHVE